MPWPIPPRMAKALAGGEPYSYGAQIQFFTPAVGNSGEPTTPWMPVADGSIAISSTTSALRTLQSCKFEPVNAATGKPVAGIVPLTAKGPVAPYGRECRIQAGCFYSDGTADLIPVGVFPILGVGQYAPGYIEIQSSPDRSSRYSRILTYTVTTDAFHEYTYAIAKLLKACQVPYWPSYPGVPGYEADRPDFTSGGANWPIRYANFGYSGAITNGYTMPAMTFTTGDVPWDQATKIAAAVGQLLDHDPTGLARTYRVIDTQAGDPVWKFVAGDGAIFADTARTLSQVNGNDTAINHAIVMGASIDGSAPVRADSFDLDPDSPTFWNPPFGYGDQAQVLNASAYIFDGNAAQAAADAFLAANRGAIEGVQFNCIPLPHLTAWDLLQVTSPTSGADALYQLGSATLPLTPAKMAVTTRNRRLTT